MIDRVDDQRRLTVMCLFKQRQIFFVKGCSSDREAVQAYSVYRAIGVPSDGELLGRGEGEESGHGEPAPLNWSLFSSRGDQLASDISCRKSGQKRRESAYHAARP